MINLKSHTFKSPITYFYNDKRVGTHSVFMKTVICFFNLTIILWNIFMR